MKKKIAIIASVLLITFGSASNAESQWVQTNGPYGGFIWKLVANGPNLYAWDEFTDSTRLSTDRGKSWGVNYNKYWNPFRVNDTLLFIYTLQGLERSVDNGGTWTKAPAQIKNILSIIPKGSYIFANTSDSGIFRSSDYGSSWKRLKSSVIGNSFAYVVATIDTIIFATTQYNRNANSVANILRSMDNGETWKSIHKGLSDTLGFSVATIGNILLVGTDEGFYTSTDYGSNWKIKRSNKYYMPIFPIIVILKT